MNTAAPLPVLPAVLPAPRGSGARMCRWRGCTDEVENKYRVHCERHRRHDREHQVVTVNRGRVEDQVHQFIRQHHASRWFTVKELKPLLPDLTAQAIGQTLSRLVGEDLLEVEVSSKRRRYRVRAASTDVMRTTEQAPS